MQSFRPKSSGSNGNQHLIENIVNTHYTLAKDGNCAYAAVIIGLMHKAFSDQLVGEHSQVGSCFLKKITDDERKNPKEIFEYFLSGLNKNEEYGLLAEVFVLVLRQQIVDYALQLSGKEKNLIKCAIQPTDMSARIEDEKYEQHFQNVTNPDYNTHGGLPEFLIVEMMFGLNITAANDFRSMYGYPRENATAFLVLDIQQDGEFHYKVVEQDGTNENVASFCAKTVTQYKKIRAEIDGETKSDKEVARVVAKEARAVVLNPAISQASAPSSMSSVQSPSGSLQRSKAVSNLALDFFQEIERYLTRGNVQKGPYKDTNVDEAEHRFEGLYEGRDAIEKDVHEAKHQLAINPLDKQSRENICKKANALFPSLQKEEVFVVDKSIYDDAQFKKIYSALQLMAFSGKKAQYRIDGEYLLTSLHAVPAFNALCDHMMYENSVSNDNAETGLQRLTKISESQFSHLKILEKQSKNLRAGIIKEIGELSFEWKELYLRGIDENNDKILKNRQEIQFIAAQELGKLLNKFEKSPGSVTLSTEERCVLMNAIADAENVQTPFHCAFKLLAIQRKTTVGELRNLLLDGYQNHCAQAAKASSFVHEVFEHYLKTLIPHMNYTGNFLADSSSKQQNLLTPASVKSVNTANSTTKTRNVVWNDLHNKCFDSNGDPTKYKMSDDDVETVFSMFDQQCYNASDISALAPFFGKAYDEMNNYLNDKGSYKTSRGIFGSIKMNAPVDYKRYTDLIAPKDLEQPPYAFALYCYYLCQQGKSEALPHEREFIQKYLVTLEVHRDKLNSITINDKPLGDCVAPITSNESSPQCPLDLIYPKLAQEVFDLAKRSHLKVKEIQPYMDIFTDHLKIMHKMSVKQDQNNLVYEMIKQLYKKARDAENNDQKSFKITR